MTGIFCWNALAECRIIISISYQVGPRSIFPSLYRETLAQHNEGAELPANPYERTALRRDVMMRKLRDSEYTSNRYCH